MPAYPLFGINNEGRVYSLSTAGSGWRELPYVGQEFKKISALPHFLWAVGGDHQIYVYVHGLDIPIRVREESFENERWLPIEGFSSRLLPTDRYHFSSANGLVDRSFDKIRLPSMAWQWEGDWKLELTLNGQPLDHNGWTYAVDFPTQYYPKKQWSSCVRRRLWVRSRRYGALNSWCAIAPLHKDPTNEPFIDVSIGGQSVPGAPEGTMTVWAITAHNRVMFRADVSSKFPEGARWTSISVPLGSETMQINVGPTGLVWATLVDGRALVRVGVTRDNLQGTNWVELRGPGKPGSNLRISQIAVGLNAVWVITQDFQVWFRKGIKGEEAGRNEDAAIGSKWVEMVGKLALITLCPNDQVFGLGADDRRICFRTEVNSRDLTGKRWRTLTAPLQVSRASSNASLSRDKFHKSSNALSRPSSMFEPSALLNFNEQPHSAPTAPASLPVGDLTKFETQPKFPRAWSPMHSAGSIVGTEVHPDTDDSIWSESSRDSCIFTDEEELHWADYEAPWSWVEAGACFVDPNSLPNWFTDFGSAMVIGESSQEWRKIILESLKKRISDPSKYAKYKNAIDTSSWVHSGEARVSLRNSAFVDCIVQLEWVHSNGTLTILNPDGATTMSSFSMSEISCVQLCSEPGNPRLAIYVPRLSPSCIKLQFPSDTILDEWQANIYNTCVKTHNITGKPSGSSIWAVSNFGEIFVWDPTPLESTQLRENDFYVQKYDLRARESPIKVALRVGCLPSTVITLSGCIGEDADRIGINLDADSTYKLKSKSHTELENTPLHFNIRFNDCCVVRNSMIEGKWGKEERDGQLPFTKGQEFTLRFETTEDAFLIYINNEKFCSYRHRISPQSVAYLSIWGRLQPFRLVIKSPEIIIDPYNIYWRPLGGHVRKIESSIVGVTWAISYDQTAWVYTNGWGGGCIDQSESHNVFPMTDSQDYKLYENQRWNPFSGYTSTGLPTDRPMWSDASGKQKRVKDQVKLLSKHWQWVSDWMIDFNIPGGCDQEGWQYAVDFPASYHPTKNFTDYVRRRRWYRRCAINLTGPWQELGHTKITDVVLEPVKNDVDTELSVWALAAGGQPMLRTGVCRSNPMGNCWEHVNSDKPLISISCNPFNNVWAIGSNGLAYLRVGITEDKLEGEKWLSIQPPPKAHLKQISVGPVGVWVVDNSGKIYVREGITSTNMEGTGWKTITITPPIINAASNTKGFKQVNVGKIGVWAVTDGGLILRRMGICLNNISGSGWDILPSGKWQYVNVKAFN